MQTPELIAIIVAGLGVLGTVLPFIPGIPLVLAAILGYAFYDHMRHFTVLLLLIISLLGFLGIISEYLIAYLGAKYFGASKYAFLGAFGGSILGLMLFPPFGLFLGALLGAAAGEYYNAHDIKKAIHASWGTVIGLLTGGLFRFFIALSIFIIFLYKIY